MATNNRLTDSTKKETPELQRRMEKSRKRLQVAHLNSTAGKNEQIGLKDPTVAAAKKRSKTAALASKNMSGRYPNSIEYGDEDAHYESQSVRHPKEWKRANFGKNRDLSAANTTGRKAVSKPKRIANDLSTKMERLEKKNIKGPSNLVHMNRDPQQANMNARFAAYKEETKREELRTANRHKWSDASPASESRAEKNPKQFDTLVKHKRNPGRANMVASRAVRKSKLANDFAASELPNIVKKRQTGTKKTVNRGLEAGIAKRPGAMMPKSTGPAKKSTRVRKTSK